MQSTSVQIQFVYQQRGIRRAQQTERYEIQYAIWRVEQRHCRVCRWQISSITQSWNYSLWTLAVKYVNMSTCNIKLELMSSAIIEHKHVGRLYVYTVTATRSTSSAHYYHQSCWRSSSVYSRVCPCVCVSLSVCPRRRTDKLVIWNYCNSVSTCCVLWQSMDVIRFQ